jgi:hypothetical protein
VHVHILKSKGKLTHVNNYLQTMCVKEKQLTQLLYGCLARLRLLNQLHYLAANVSAVSYTVKKVSGFPVASRDVNNQTDNLFLQCIHFGPNIFSPSFGFVTLI